MGRDDVVANYQSEHPAHRRVARPELAQGLTRPLLEVIDQRMPLARVSPRAGCIPAIFTFYPEREREICLADDHR
ncbi:MAG TPA: hypothetical protein DCM14_00385 [Clostridiales bacterium UBA8153]|nr:hypothetical protein [Clostridiales bacterium UBA8153]